MNSTSTRTVAPSSFVTKQQPRIAALALSAVLTLSMLMGIHTLAALDEAAPQMAQSTQARA